MTSWEEEERQEAKLRRAVLDALTERVNRLPVTPRLDTRHLPDCAGYKVKRGAPIRLHEDSHWRDVGLSDEDDDWRDIRASGDDPSLPPDNYLHFYDAKTDTVYYVEDERPKRTGLGADIPSDDVLASARIPSEERRIPEFEDQEVRKVLTRLELMNGQLGPHGYSAWLSKKLQRRFDTESDIPGFSALCDQCRSILTHSLLVFHFQFENEWRRTGLEYRARHHYEALSHHKTLAALRASAKAGCHLCSLLLGSDVRDENVVCCDKGHSTTYFLAITSQDYIRDNLHITGQSLGLRATLSWKNEQDNSPSTLWCTSTDALEVRNLARSWLSRCLQEDQGICSISTTFLPSRLVKITTKNGTWQSACLVLKEELPPDTKYLTLSHCWGVVKPVFLLTQQTLKEFRTDIPESFLSKTFQEALQVATWLDHCYIWIDSLCILQDSPADWKHEAALMGNIYRHSTCTIAATGARDGKDGLFFERSALAFEKCPLFEGPLGRRLYAENKGKWPSPLASRAWAVQERCLSSRTINFGSDKISWACRRGEACEGPDAHDIRLNKHSFPKLLDGDTDEKSADEAWKNTVREYSACKLTFWEDKWPAFQGLTIEVERAQNWKIMHGLRRHLLGKDLMWHVGNRETGLSTIEHGEPSWSWLNVQGEIDWPFIGMVDAKVVLPERSAPADAGDATNNSTEDVIEIEACMIKFKADVSAFGGYHCTLEVTNLQYQMYNESGRLLRGYWYPDTVPFHHDDLQALQICSQWLRSNRYESWDHDMVGLVVTPVQGRPRFWRRVGLYSIYSKYKLPEEDLESEASNSNAQGTNVSTPSEPSADELIPVNSSTDRKGRYGVLSQDETALRGLPCPWNREKTIIKLI